MLTDPVKLQNTVLTITMAAAGIYGTREVARAVGKQVEMWLGTPSLVRETSKSRPWLLGGAKKGQNVTQKTGQDVTKGFDDVVLPAPVFDHVRKLAAATANTKRHGAPFRHMLFYGPPGTGKTLAAKKLARTSGLDYAIMSGGDVAPLGGAAVTQLHSVFDWAERSPRGLMLFIDEADAFLGRRSENQSEASGWIRLACPTKSQGTDPLPRRRCTQGLRGALNALLFRTGDQSKDFVVVMATNRPGDLDKAVLDRMDEHVEFPLPESDERVKMLELYLDKYILKAGTEEGGAGAQADKGLASSVKGALTGRRTQPLAIEVRGLSSEDLRWAAERTKGFSGRELAKLMAAVQSAVYGSHEPVLTPELFRQVVDMKLQQHEMRKEFEVGTGSRANYV